MFDTGIFLTVKDFMRLSVAILNKVDFQYKLHQSKRANAILECNTF